MVRIGADFSSITAQAKKSQQSMSRMQKSVNRSCSSMQTAVSGVKRAFGALGIGLSVAAVTAFAKSAKEAYETQAVASSKLAQVMRNTMGASADEVKSINELIDAQERAGIVAGDAQTEGAQELATYLELSSSLRTLIPVMNDMIAQQYGLSATGENVVSIATMMGKVMNGQTSALSRYGYSFTAAQEAILKYGNEAQRAATLAAVVSESVGGMNNALAATPSGRLQQVNNALGKIKEEFGGAVTTVLTAFLPALNAVCNVLASAATLASRVAQSIANVFGSGAKGAKSSNDYVYAAADGMGELADSTAQAGNAGEKAKKQLGTFGFDTLQKLSSSQSSSSSAASPASSAASSGGGVSVAPGINETGESVGWLENALKRIQTAAKNLDFSPLNKSFDGLKSSAGKLADVLSNSLSWAFDNVLVPFANITIGAVLPAEIDVLSAAFEVLNSVLDAFSPLGKWLLDKFLVPIGKWTGGYLSKRLESVAFGLKTIGEWIEKLKSPAGWLAGALEGARSSLSNVGVAFTAAGIAGAMWAAKSVAATVATTSLGASIGLACAPVMAITAGIAALIAVVVLLIKNWDKVKSTATKAWEGIKSVWGKSCSWVKTKVLNPITNAFKTFANGIVSKYENIFNFAIAGINLLIKGFNKIKVNVPDWVPKIGGKQIGFNIPTIGAVSLPRLADGAVFKGNDPYLAIVNDQKHGVNVETPLRTMIDAMNIALRQNGGAGGQVEVVNNVKFEGTLSALARALAPAIVSEIRRVGNSASQPLTVGT